MRIPIYFEGDLSTDELERIFRDAGYVIRTERGQLVARRLPPLGFIRKDPPNVVTLRQGPRRARP